MIKFKLLLILVSLNCFSHPVINVYGDANKEFISFWTTQYLKWSIEEMDLSKRFSKKELELIQFALNTYSSWANKTGDNYQDSFRFGFKVIKKEMIPTFYIAINDEIKNQKNFRNYIKENWGMDLSNVRAIEFYGHQGIDFYYSNYVKSYRGGAVVKWDYHSLAMDDFVSTKRLINHKSFFSQSIKASKKTKCYETRFRSISLERLPKQLVKMAALHENTWNLLIGGIEECDNKEVKIFFP